MLANGIRGEIDLADAEDLCDMLVKLGRAVPPASWVPWIAAEAARKRSTNSLNRLF